MNARELQTAQVADLNKLFKDSLYKTPSGEMAKPSFFKQFLPKRQSEEDDDPFPYGIIRLDNGAIAGGTDPHKVGTIILIGIFDDAPENQGHTAVLEIMEKIQEHYQNNPVIADLNGRIIGRLDTQTPISWALQDEESYPYFFGGLNLTWDLPAPRTKVSDLV